MYFRRVAASPHWPHSPLYTLILDNFHVFAIAKT
jgi:hypothetical protein